MEGLAEKYGLTPLFIAEWNTCTFVYVLRRDEATSTLQLAYVSSELAVSLSEPCTLKKQQHDLLMRMHRPALVFAPSYLLTDY